MRRQLGVTLLARITRNGCSTTNSTLISPKSLLKSNLDSFHQRSLSEYSTLSRSHFRKICSPNGAPGAIQSVIFGSRRFFSNALWKGRPKIPVTVGNGRFYNSFNSLNRGRSFFGRVSADGVVIGLIVTNVAVFLLWRVADTQFMINNFMISVDNFKSGRLHTLITCAFSHNDTFHIISNMIGLYFFGMSVGQTFGAQFLLKLYLSGAIAGSIFYLAYHAFIAPSLRSGQMQGFNYSRIPALGASGAVNAIMLLDLFLFPTKTVYLDFFIPVPAMLLGIFMIGKDMLRVLEGDPKISGAAHLGGATVGALAWLKYRKGRFGRF